MSKKSTSETLQELANISNESLFGSANEVWEILVNDLVSEFKQKLREKVMEHEQQEHRYFQILCDHDLKNLIDHEGVEAKRYDLEFSTESLRDILQTLQEEE